MRFRAVRAIVHAETVTAVNIHSAVFVAHLGTAEMIVALAVILAITPLEFDIAVRPEWGVFAAVPAISTILVIDIDANVIATDAARVAVVVANTAAGALSFE